MSRARVGIVGTSGYVGGELLRWLLSHPDVTVEQVVSRTRPDTAIDVLLPALAGWSRLRTRPFEPESLARLDAVFLATPHGTAAPLVAALEEAGAPRILDLSSDHRHAPGWRYGQPEWAGEALRHAPRIAVPGCFATAITLALAPLAHAGCIAGPVSIAATTGSTGSGARPKATTHHPERFADFRAYNVLQHRHTPEIRRFLEHLGQKPELLFVPHSGPFDRGIFATCFVPVRPTADVHSLFAEAYEHAPLIRLRSETPHMRHVRGTALCDLAVHVTPTHVVVLSTLDNLGKGAAAQAVQCLNLSLGLPDDRGLRAPPLTP